MIMRLRLVPGHQVWLGSQLQEVGIGKGLDGHGVEGGRWFGYGETLG